MREELLLGMPTIDDQHRAFSGVVRRLAKLADKDEASRDDLATCGADLLRYVLEHFTTEERLFNESEYPDADEHVSAHAAFRDIVDDYVERLNDEETGDEPKAIAREMASIAREWFEEHVREMDALYVAHLRARGLM